MTADLQDRVIWTIGHSNREAAELIDLLSRHAIRLVADVRRFPGSRRLPQFNRGNLEAAFGEAGIGYRHFEDLGGRRSGRRPDSPNTAWRVESFNAYADHMQTPEFRAALAELEAAASDQPTAIMCAEALPWRCHRRLIADALLARGWKVLDILSSAAPKERTLTDFARVDGEEVTYPGGTLF